MLKRPTPLRRQQGFSMIEVLVTLVILTFGLLGLAGLQMRIQGAEMEAYQRAQALVLLNNMAERINGNRANAAAYLTTAPLGTDDDQPASCSGVAAGVLKDRCEWSNDLKGAGEQAGGNVGAMIGGRGCVTQVQAQDATAGVCTPGIYRISVAWQGLSPTAAPGDNCGQGLYGAEALRRVVSIQTAVGLVSCS